MGINYFEWRFEFPEALDGDGNFVGFDAVIGNPPYIQLQKPVPGSGGKHYGDLYQDMGYETFVRSGDIYMLFYEKGLKLLAQKGVMGIITSNKWMRSGYGKVLRRYLIRYNPTLLIDLGPSVFDTASVDCSILIISNEPNQEKCYGLVNCKEDIRRWAAQ